MVQFKTDRDFVFLLVGKTMAEIDDLLGAIGREFTQIFNASEELFIFQRNSISRDFDHRHIAR